MTTSADQAAIQAVLTAVDRAYHDRNATEAVSHYTPDARIADLAPPLAHPIDGAKLAAWFSTWEGPVEREIRDLVITSGGELAFCHCLVKVSAVTKQGGHHATWWMRSTSCLRREGATWKIAHEHTSVPFLMDGSFKAAVDLTP